MENSSQEGLEEKEGLMPHNTSLNIALVLCLIMLVSCCLGCGRASILPGDYSGQFDWKNGLQQIHLTPESDASRIINVDKGIREQLESIIRQQITFANVSTARGTFTISVLENSYAVISLKHFEIQDPNMSELLMLVNAQDLDQIRHFIDQRNNVNQRDLPNLRTALFLAAAGTKIQSSQVLLSLGADPNLADFEGDTPLIAAITANSQEGVQQLIHARANVNQSNQKGRTPLLRAVELGRPKLVKLLLDSGADPNYVAPNGDSALSVAREKRDSSVLAVLGGSSR